ncbi:hypothetical protein [Actinokineospora sp. NBRC 105648]|uniref:AMIN-like domain-containing (lipo)protein n=1 Tax=Actinokineospora sp. NBRC 105648 TaxID=3032206 RepID=UPI0024A52D36|nr:hypothetical protein [Actinokineospora sp. NBRC 105648]GLZ41447.1 hypothetical protein Acsp05_50710 [Actinokineospora sp. NBRC 105648]
MTTLTALTAIRVGRHETFDRVVLDFTGPVPQVAHEFTDELISDPSGEIEWLTGSEFIQLTLQPAAAHDDAGNPTFPGPRKFRTRELANVQAVVVDGDFEGVLSVGLGLRVRTSVKVFDLASPNRLVIDVAH